MRPIVGRLVIDKIVWHFRCDFQSCAGLAGCRITPLMSILSFITRQ